MLRSLSFSRRRSKSSRDPSARSTSKSDVTKGRDEDDAADDAPGPLQPLSSQVLKRNRGMGWSKRWLEVDDTLGILYIYRSELDRQRKTPAHLYLCSDMASIQPASCNAANHCFEIQLHAGSRAHFYSCSSDRDVHNWLVGLHARSKLGPNFGSRSLKCARIGEFGVTLANWEGQPIGVTISTIEEESVLAAAGLRVGDAIIAIDGQACLSHTHAMQILNDLVSGAASAYSARDAGDAESEFIVWSPLRS